MAIEAEFLACLDRIAVAWERIAYANEASLEIAREGLKLQLQMASSSAALEEVLKASR